MKKSFFLIIACMLLILASCGEQESENNFYRVVSVNKKKLTAIEAYYEWDGSSFSMTMLEGTDNFEMLKRYFDCEIEEVEIPMDAYEVDPVSFIFDMGNQKSEIFFITTEEGDGKGQSLYLIQDEKAYRLLCDINDWNEIGKEIWGEDEYIITELPRNPIMDFLHYNRYYVMVEGSDWPGDSVTFEKDGLIVTYVGEKPVFPGVGGMNYHLYRSYEEMLQEADFIVIGTIQDMRMETVLDIDYWLMSALLSVRVDKVLRGESDTEEIEVLRWGDSVQVGPGGGRPLGMSEHRLQVGEQYLIFMNAEGLVDRYVGMMEITEDGMLRPTFSVSLDEIEEYYIPLQTLKDML